MKILLTGFTARQTNTIRESSKTYISFTSILTEMLTRLGHTVDNRAVMIGEDLSGYDCVFAGLSNPTTMTGMAHRYGGMWALASHKNVIGWFDDWRFKEQFMAWIRKPDGAFSSRLWAEKRMPEFDLAMEWKHHLLAAFDVIKDRKIPFIAQLFPWGDLDIMERYVPDARWFIRFDPSVFVPVHNSDPLPIEMRHKAWVSAALSNTDEWIRSVKPEGTGWGIVTATKPKGGNRFGGGWKKIKEPELVRTLYRSNIGVLSHPYNHAGSGWWRVRFNYATQTRSILFGSPEETHAIGEPFRYPIQEIEAMDDQQLDSLSSRQTQLFNTLTRPAEAVLAVLQAGIDRATAEASMSALEAAS